MERKNRFDTQSILFAVLVGCIIILIVSYG